METRILKLVVGFVILIATLILPIFVAAGITTTKELVQAYAYLILYIVIVSAGIYLVDSSMEQDR